MEKMTTVISNVLYASMFPTDPVYMQSIHF